MQGLRAEASMILASLCHLLSCAPGMVKPSCLGVLVVSMDAGAAVAGRSATAAALTAFVREAVTQWPARDASKLWRGMS